MRIEWLNDEMTEACLTRGWWRKQYAIVKLTPMRHLSGCYWAYVPSGDEVGESIRRKLDIEKRMEEWRRKEARIGSNWAPVMPMPQARQVRR